ncbi:MAG: tRNA (adenosine(37)-N6)-dimethylallyltransferase MiaA [Dehalococcoidia bacterium]|nr:MAG: tRNA (adenosine(37)-N6)-dimethylallyltransferase MiaA [Dehalococcoidia bacterium]
MKRVIAIVGPTGVGKSALALKLAQDFHGEIISADSRQVYRRLDIGTAKPSRAEQASVSHHLIDIVNPDHDFSLAQYQELAYKTIDEIASRGHVPLLVGGSGLYVWAVLEGWQIPRVAPDAGLRKCLEERAAQGESEKLYEELKQLDAEAASRIDPRNIRRVIRALEIKQKSLSSNAPTKIKPPFDYLIVGLTASREALYRRIDERVDSMVNRGLVEEVRRLINKGYGLELPSMSGIGYHQIGFSLQGKISLDKAIQQVKNESHRLVRQQYNWFGPKDDRIHWFDVDAEPYIKIKTMVTEFLNT